MIAIYEGKIGGGKTYLAVCRILAHLAKGGTVFTNIELHMESCVDYCAKHYNVSIDPDAVEFFDETSTGDFHKFLRAGASSDCPVLCVVDEAHLWFNAKDHALTATMRRQLLVFLSQSRKLHVDCVFIVQAADNLDAQFRRLAQEVWRMKDLSRFRVPLLNIGYPWPHTIAFRTDTGTKQLMEKKLLLRSPEIFACYNTNALLRPVEFAGEVQGRRRLERVEAKPRRAYFSWLDPRTLIWQIRAIWDAAGRWQPGAFFWGALTFCAILSIRLWWEW